MNSAVRKFGLPKMSGIRVKTLNVVGTAENGKDDRVNQSEVDAKLQE